MTTGDDFESHRKLAAAYRSFGNQKEVGNHFYQMAMSQEAGNNKSGFMAIAMTNGNKAAEVWMKKNIPQATIEAPAKAPLLSSPYYSSSSSSSSSDLDPNSSSSSSSSSDLDPNSSSSSSSSSSWVPNPHSKK